MGVVRAGDARGPAELNESGWLSVRSEAWTVCSRAATKHNEPRPGSQGQSVNPAEKQKSTFSCRLIQIHLTGRHAGSQFTAKLSERKERRETRAAVRRHEITKYHFKNWTFHNEPFTDRRAECVVYDY